MLNYRELESAIKYEFKDKLLLERALTHSSYAAEHGLSYEFNNERLEFIGDAYLDAVIGFSIYTMMPSAHEGSLSKYRANVVCEDSLAEIAREIQLGNFLRLGNGEMSNGGNEKNSILSDALEALIGAVILDSGYDSCKKLILYLFKDMINLAIEGKLNRDYKSKLQEIIQSKYKNLDIKYVLTNESGPDHNKVFNVDVIISGKVCGKGSGRSKSKAEQEAAKFVILKGEF